MVLYLRPPFKSSCIQDDTLLVMREHVASGETLQKAVIIAAIPLADFAVHLHITSTCKTLPSPKLTQLHADFHCLGADVLRNVTKPYNEHNMVMHYGKATCY